MNEPTLTPPEPAPDADDGAAGEAVTYALSTDSIATYSAGVDASMTVAAQSETYIDVPTDKLVIDSNGVFSGIKSDWCNKNPLQNGQYYKIIIPDTVTSIKAYAFNSTACGEIIGSVSYTHLDVYKRQVQHVVDKVRADETGAAGDEISLHRFKVLHSSLQKSP